MIMYGNQDCTTFHGGVRVHVRKDEPWDLTDPKSAQFVSERPDLFKDAPEALASFAGADAKVEAPVAVEAKPEAVKPKRGRPRKAAE